MSANKKIIMPQSKESIRIACAQIYTEPGQVRGNCQKMLEAMDKAKYLGAEIVTFHENYFSDYYVPEIRDFSETLPGPISKEVMKKAKQLKLFVIFGIGELINGKHYNAAVLIGPSGNIIGKYHKTHLSVVDRSGTIVKEVDTYEPGYSYPVFETSLGKIGMMICKDGFYMEVPLILGLKGCELLFWITNRHEVARDYATVIASQTRTVLTVCNRAGNSIAGGGSCILNCGEELVSAGKGETILVTDVDITALRAAQKHWREVQHLRRPETYEILAQSHLHKIILD